MAVPASNTAVRPCVSSLADAQLDEAEPLLLSPRLPRRPLLSLTVAVTVAALDAAPFSRRLALSPVALLTKISDIAATCRPRPMALLLVPCRRVERKPHRPLPPRTAYSTSEPDTAIGLPTRPKGYALCLALVVPRASCELATPDGRAATPALIRLTIASLAKHSSRPLGQEGPVPQVAAATALKAQPLLGLVVRRPDQQTSSAAVRRTLILEISICYGPSLGRYSRPRLPNTLSAVVAAAGLPLAALLALPANNFSFPKGAEIAPSAGKLIFLFILLCWRIAMASVMFSSARYFDREEKEPDRRRIDN